MNPDSRALISSLIACGALRFGDFTLKSGQASPFFVNLGDVAAGPDLARLGAALAAAVARDFPEATLLFGPAYKGIVLATAASVAAWQEFGRSLPLCYDRKEAKGHGEGGAYIGQLPRPEDRVVIVDDVLSSGGTKLQAARRLEEDFGVRPVGMLVALDRRRAGEELDPALPPLTALAALPDLIRYLEEADPARAATVDAFYRGEA